MSETPTDPTRLHWFFRRSGRQVGPLTWSELTTLYTGGEILADDEVSSDGITWTAAGSVVAPRSDASATRPALDYDVVGSRPTVMSAFSCSMLAQTSPYVRIVSILLFVGCLAIVLTPLVALATSPSLGRDIPAAELVISLLLAAVLVIPAALLAHYATNARSFGKFRDPHCLDAALEAQKSFWKFTACFALLIVALYVATVSAAFILSSLHPHV